MAKKPTKLVVGHPPQNKRVGKPKEKALTLVPKVEQTTQVMSTEQVTKVAKREAGLPVGIGINMQSLMERAIDKMVPLDYLERLIGLVEKQRAQWAKERFFEDLALAQAEFPIIEKTTKAMDHSGCSTCKGKGQVDGNPCPDGKLLYVYSQKGDIVEKIGPIVGKYGFSATSRSRPFKHADLGTSMMAGTCIVRHKDGHQEETTIEVPIGEGNRLLKGMQLYMATSTFAERYAYKKAFGISERGEDVDHMEESEEPMEQPQAVKGVQVNKEGVKEQHADQEKSDPPAPTSEDIKKAKEEFQVTINKVAQWYDKDGDPMLSGGKPWTKTPPNDHPGQPCHRNFTNEEINEYIAEAHKKEDDPVALRRLGLDLMALLGERVTDFKANKGEKA